MKRKRRKQQRNKAAFISLVVLIFLVLFVGFVLCNVFAVIINCLFEGFGSFLFKLCELPYLVYLLISFVLSLALALIIGNKTKL